MTAREIFNQCVEEQLFARRPRGKVWAGSAALENATGVEGRGKKFREAADPLVPFFFRSFRISKIFSYIISL